MLPNLEVSSFLHAWVYCHVVMLVGLQHRHIINIQVQSWLANQDLLQVWLSVCSYPWIILQRLLNYFDVWGNYILATCVFVFVCMHCMHFQLNVTTSLLTNQLILLNIKNVCIKFSSTEPDSQLRVGQAKSPEQGLCGGDANWEWESGELTDRERERQVTTCYLPEYVFTLHRKRMFLYRCVGEMNITFVKYSRNSYSYLAQFFHILVFTSQVCIYLF